LQCLTPEAQSSTLEAHDNQGSKSESESEKKKKKKKESEAHGDLLPNR
jgi:hypothetical protein